MNWSTQATNWPTGPTASQIQPATPVVDPRDSMGRDELLIAWEASKIALEKAKAAEMDLRKYIVKRAFPNPTEGVNKQELGNGYELKAGVKFNYKLDADNEKIENALNRITKIGNKGPFIADRLVSWTPNFLLTEYRNLQAEADDGSLEAKEMLKIITEVLTITDAAPSLEIKEPKGKK